MKILVCGGNGAGKSTLAAKLSEMSGFPYVDTEHYYFPQAVDGYAYGAARRKEEVAALLLADLQNHDHFIFASVTGDFGGEVLAQFTHAVLVCVPRELRLERVRERSLRKFGERARPGGDLYEQEDRFLEMVKARPEGRVEEWLSATGLPVLRVDGTKPPEENAARILRELLQ